MFKILFQKLGSTAKKLCKRTYLACRTRVFGYHKRDLVIAEVGHACTGLVNTRDQFQNALREFKMVIICDNSNLENRYQLLQRQYAFCQQKSALVASRITAIEEVSADLFVEWEQELKLYSNAMLRSKSRQQLKAAKRQYKHLIKTMHRAQSHILPVQNAFKDQVLFLKHNLNANAIATLQNEFVEIGIDIHQLIEVMEATIDQASNFVAALTEQKALPS